MDASLRSLAQFDNPSRWVVVPGVPVFDTFEMDVPAKQLPTGAMQPATKVKFDLGQLHAMCQKANRREATTGDVCPLTLGHTIPGAPETEQPPVVGYARNFRVEPFGPAQMPAATCDFWYMKEHWGQGYKADEYKRKSVELWFKGQMFDPIALLKSRTPMRDLGLIMAQRGMHPSYLSDRAGLFPVADDFKLCYSMESFAMDPTQQPNAGDDEMLERMMRCMAHPRMLECMKGVVHAAMGAPPGAHQPPPAGAPPLPGAAPHMPAAPMPPPGVPPPHQPHPFGLGMPSATNVGMPATHHPQQPPHHQPQHSPQHYSQVFPEEQLRLQREWQEQMAVQLQRHQTDMQEIQRQAKLARAERLVSSLFYQGYEMDGPDEVQHFMAQDEGQWPKMVDRVKRNYKPRENNPNPAFDESAIFATHAPVGGAILPGLERRPDAPDKPPSQAETEKAMNFIRQHPEWESEQAWDKAMQMVRPSANGSR